jgi:uncharacterized membrane protein YraQ (UPF0718 family)
MMFYIGIAALVAGIVGLILAKFKKPKEVAKAPVLEEVLEVMAEKHSTVEPIKPEVKAAPVKAEAPKKPAKKAKAAPKKEVKPAPKATPKPKKKDAPKA